MQINDKRRGDWDREREKGKLYAAPWAQLFERRLALFLSKAHYGIIFSIIFRVSSHQIVGKEN